MDSSTLMIYKCPLCKLTFSNDKFLIDHIEQHTKKIISCNICGINYKYKKNFDRHILIKHSENNEIKCNDCGKQYSRKEHLMRHACGTNCIKEKRFACKSCGKTFHRKDILQRHEKNH